MAAAVRERLDRVRQHPRGNLADRLVAVGQAQDQPLLLQSHHTSHQLFGRWPGAQKAGISDGQGALIQEPFIKGQITPHIRSLVNLFACSFIVEDNDFVSGCMREAKGKASFLVEKKITHSQLQRQQRLKLEEQGDSHKNGPPSTERYSTKKDTQTTC